MEGSASTSVVQDHVEEHRNPYMDMVIDVTYDVLNPEAKEMEEDPNPSTSKFYNLLSDVDESLWRVARSIQNC